MFDLNTLPPLMRRDMARSLRSLYSKQHGADCPSSLPENERGVLYKANGVSGLSAEKEGHAWRL